MKITILGSGSTGNAYIVSDGETSILLECGISWRRMQTASGFRMSSIDGCLISHEHGDHSKHVSAVMRNGINVFTSRGTADALGIKNHFRTCIVQPHGVFQIGTWNVMALPVEHDAAEPFGYLLGSRALGEKMLFATDTPYLPYNIPGLTHAMVEANYDYANMDIADGRLNQRVMKSHMSIDALEEWLRTGEARTTLQQIWLLHLSDERSNEAEFKRRIQAICGCEVYVA